MRNQVLSIEQMQHLQELGVDTSKASCYWWYAEGRDYLYWGKCSDANGIPTFNLQDMLEMMPKKILIEMENDFCRSVEAFFLEASLNICNDNWQCGYIHFSKREDCIDFKYENTDLLTCTYETLCWLAKNNYIGGNNGNDKTLRL